MITIIQKKKKIHTHLSTQFLSPKIPKRSKFTRIERTKFLRDAKIDQSPYLLTCTINEIATSPWLLCCASLILWYNSALYPYTCIWNRERHVEREEIGGQDLFFWSTTIAISLRTSLFLLSARNYRRQISLGTGRKGEEGGRGIAAALWHEDTRVQNHRLARNCNVPSPFGSSFSFARTN